MSVSMAKGIGFGLSMLAMPLTVLGAEGASADFAAAPSESSPAAVSNPASLSADAASVPLAEPQTVAAPTRNRAIEEIVVTAQKRAENIQDVPISIQAFSGDALAARGVDDTTQLGQSIPSLNFTQVLGFQLIYIRGIGSDQFLPSADPSIATYVDGIYVPSGQSTVTSLGNVERVEVLKGPQGTLFGRNSTGGAISVVTADPGNTFKASAEIEGGNFADRSAKVNVSGPIASWFSAGVSGVYSYENSYYTDTFYKLEPSKVGAARLKLKFDPLDNLSIGLAGFYTQQRGVNTLIGINTTPSDLGKALLITPQPDSYTVNSDYHAQSKSQQALYYGNATWKLPWLDIKALGSIDHLLVFDQADYDGSSQPIAAFATTKELFTLKTAELQFVSNASTPLADRFQWVGGFFYLQSIAGFDPGELRAGPSAIATAAAIANIPVPAALQTLANDFPATAAGDTGEEITFGGLLGTKSYSAFVQATYKFTNWVDLTLGGRFQHERRYLTKSQTGLEGPDGTTDPTLIPFPLPSATATNFSPKAVLSFHLGENELVYASYAVGFKSGTYNIVNIYEAPNYIVPEQVKTYELGAKVDLLHGLLRLNGALFDNQIKNLQSGFVSLLSGGAVTFDTAPAAQTRGAEFDGTFVPLPTLDDGLALTANAAYVDAKYTDFPCGPGFDKTTGVYRSCLDFDGHQIVRAPKLSGGLGLVQTIDLTHGSLEFAADEYYNSGFFYDPYNTVREGKYFVLNSHASYLYSPWRTRVTLYGKNLLDRRYHLQQFQTDFGITKTLAPPREYGIRLNFDF